MFFETWSEFLAMGGYGFYVWLAYGATFFSVIALGGWEFFRRRAFIQQLKRQSDREARLAKRANL